MKPPQSVLGRLTRGLSGVALFGGLALIVFVSFDVDVMLEQQSAEVGWRGTRYEIIEHVVIPLLLLMAPMYFAGRWVIRAAFAPLGIAAARVDMVAGTDRGFRLDLDGLPAEAQPFAAALNNLLERLDDAAGQREAFAANVAHELRTPLAILMVELDRMGTVDALRLKKDVAAMKRLVGQIMLMAQVQAYTASPTARNRIALDDIATEAATRFAPLAALQDRHIALDLDANGSVMVSGIREMLAAAVGNLVENGLRATPAGGTIVIAVGPGPRISIRDGGPGLSETALAALAQRFARADHASSGGAGLGLAIVAQIVEIHRGGLTTDPARREIAMTFPEPGFPVEQ